MYKNIMKLTKFFLISILFYFACNSDSGNLLSSQVAGIIDGKVFEAKGGFARERLDGSLITILTDYPLDCNNNMGHPSVGSVNINILFGSKIDKFSLQLIDGEQWWDPKTGVSITIWEVKNDKKVIPVSNIVEEGWVKIDKIEREFESVVSGRLSVRYQGQKIEGIFTVPLCEQVTLLER